MTTTDRVLCIIPARATSKRFPRKNLALIAGRPLVGQAIRVARASGIFATICVSSDSEEVLAIAREYGADVAIGREADAAAYQAQVKDVCLSVLECLGQRGQQYDAFAVLLPTSPLRRAQDVREACRLLDQSRGDGVMSLVAWEHPPQRALAIDGGEVRPYFGEQYMKTAQALEPLYRHDGSVLFMRTAAFQRLRGFYGGRLVPYLVAREHAVDVDDPIDLVWASHLVSSGVVSMGSLET